MVKREKRLKKGIVSLKKQIELHEKKQEEALQKGRIELVDYYSREIAAKGEDKRKKERILRRKKR